VRDVEGQPINIVVAKKHESDQTFKTEKEALTALRGVDGVVQCVDVMDDNTIVMEKVPGVDLIEYVNEEGSLEEDVAKGIVRQVLLILKRMATLGYHHGDVKPENIMYDEETDRVTLIDFDGKMTDRYVSPDGLKQGNNATEHGDMWSVGATTYSILTSTLLFYDRSDVLAYRLRFTNRTRRILSKQAFHFIWSLVRRHPKDRLTIEEALSHPWFTEVNIDVDSSSSDASEESDVTAPLQPPRRTPTPPVDTSSLGTGAPREYTNYLYNWCKKLCDR